jgi:hypothetical protein
MARIGTKSTNMWELEQVLRRGLMLRNTLINLSNTRKVEKACRKRLRNI